MVSAPLSAGNGPGTGLFGETKMIAEFKVTGMHCGSCATLIKMNLEEIKGVSKVEANEKGDVKVAFDEKKAAIKDMVKAIEADGYKVVHYSTKRD